MSFREKRMRIAAVTADPAIDRSKQGVVEYIRTRDQKLLPAILVPGSVPEMFTIDECARRHFDWMMTPAEGSFERYARAFRCCVKLVDGLAQSDGGHLLTWEPPTRDGIMEEASLERFSGAVILEIGAVAFEHSFFDKRMPITFLLQPLSVEAWANQTARPVAASPSSPGPSSAAASSAPADPKSPPPETANASAS